MRLWTVHPRYLDAKGLAAAWREALLAQKVLAGATRGYRHHPQLIRFRECGEPAGAVAAFLEGVRREAAARGYHFDGARIAGSPWDGTIEETAGQLACEWRHLLGKLERRAPELFARHASVAMPDAHPLFRIVPGPVRAWEASPCAPAGGSTPAD